MFQVKLFFRADIGDALEARVYGNHLVDPVC